mmetsp:Transcript_18983/g.40026  ORF Transcript_18983/g.40026 Transcript_18983/m.40026 type:complete len:260 (+) Transcript_18983:118-897(+)
MNIFKIALAAILVSEKYSTRTSASAFFAAPSRVTQQTAVTRYYSNLIDELSAGRKSPKSNPVLKMSGGGGEKVASQVPKLLRTLNSSTKWIVALGNAIGVWSRPRSYSGPFIVVGAILSVYLTEVLKKIINQSRPEGAPGMLSDPGMPSSHSLVSFFAAVGWVASLAAHDGILGKVAILVAAATVAVLRVVCQYHTWAQISVGAVLGSALGQAWWYVGEVLHLSNPQLLLYGAWGAYLSGSALFITTNMRKWATQDKHL